MGALTRQWLLFSQTILPLSALFSASLILSNMAYVHLSVSFVQMLKVRPVHRSARLKVPICLCTTGRDRLTV